MKFKYLYFKLRETIRQSRHGSAFIYLAQSLVRSNLGGFRNEVIRLSKNSDRPSGVALCCRIRDEACYLAEWIEYYLAAGVQHIYFYEKLSKDNFREVLRPYIDRGVVTLSEDWPHVPISPAADQDCILRTVGRFEWVGFFDADEFVVIGDNRSIGQFLSAYSGCAGVALHCYSFGSNGHKLRPPGSVIDEYALRESQPNMHVKCFVRPDQIAAYRNPHSWYYRGMRCAVNELGQKVRGSISKPVTAKTAWINHYVNKSDQDYFEKAARKNIQDAVGTKFANRTAERRNRGELTANATFDDSAKTYYAGRCHELRIESRIPYVFGELADSAPEQQRGTRNEAVSHVGSAT